MSEDTWLQIVLSLNSVISKFDFIIYMSLAGEFPETNLRNNASITNGSFEDESRRERTRQCHVGYASVKTVMNICWESKVEAKPNEDYLQYLWQAEIRQAMFSTILSKLKWDEESLSSVWDNNGADVLAAIAAHDNWLSFGGCENYEVWLFVHVAAELYE